MASSFIVTIFIYTMLMTFWAPPQVEGSEKGVKFLVEGSEAGVYHEFESKEEYDEWMDLSVKMFDVTFNTMCWVTQLKAYPDNDCTGYYWHCAATHKPIAERLKKAGNQCLKVYPGLVSETAKISIPVYHSYCFGFIENPKASANVSESDVLNDGGKDYAFKAYYNCLIRKLRDVHGDEIMEEVKNERTHSTKDWTQTINDRLNHFRDRHDVDPLQLDETLTNEAQKDADQMAKECKPRNASTAETICHSTLPWSEEGAILGYECANHWYAEMFNYPFPRGPEGNKTLKLVSNFAQVVWKSTKSVGYGYAYNKKCGKYYGGGYLIAKYNPGGNIPGEYAENVPLPTKGHKKFVAKPKEEPAPKFSQKEMIDAAYGVAMTKKAFDAICWFEYLKRFPRFNTKEFIRCHDERVTIPPGTYRQIKDNATAISIAQGIALAKRMSELPDTYNSNCGKLLEDPMATPETNEVYGLNDNKKFNQSYPHQAFSFCLIQTMRNIHGNKSVETVRNEKTYGIKRHELVLVDRENEARAHHGVGPLKVSAELQKSAKSWAKHLAGECKMYHSKMEQRMYKGNETIENLEAFRVGMTGENVYSAVVNPTWESFITAYMAANGWYNEIQLYPYPAGFQGASDDPLLPAIGHFTQTIWKDTKYVGYGYDANDNCKGGNGRFAVFVAHYYPMGNVIGKFVENVNLPKDN